MDPILADYRTAPIPQRLRATLELLETFTLRHEALDAAAVRAVMAHGVSKAAINDAFNVAFLFNIYDRLADTLGWELPSEAYYPKAGVRLLTHGYL
jgi:alkylhydroperoxidase family enzyme